MQRANDSSTLINHCALTQMLVAYRVGNADFDVTKNTFILDNQPQVNVACPSLLILETNLLKAAGTKRYSSDKRFRMAVPLLWVCVSWALLQTIQTTEGRLWGLELFWLPLLLTCAVSGKMLGFIHIGANVYRPQCLQAMCEWSSR